MWRLVGLLGSFAVLGACGSDSTDPDSSDGTAGTGGTSGSAGTSGTCEGTCDVAWACPGGAKLHRCEASGACSWCVASPSTGAPPQSFDCKSCGDCEAAFKQSDVVCASSGSCFPDPALDATCVSAGLPPKGNLCAASIATLPPGCEPLPGSIVVHCCP